MQILALETTGKYGSAAVTDGDGKLKYAASQGEMNHLTDIIGLIDRSLSDFGTDKSGITHVAADIGPGSFTGIRIGVSVARALGQSLGLPCIGVSSLSVLSSLAGTSQEFAELTAEGEVSVCTIINARRHQTYGAVWRDGKAVLAERQYMIEELLDELERYKGAVLFTGDGVDAYRSIIDERTASLAWNGRRVSFASEEFRYQRADAVAELALRKARRGESVVYDKLLPDYMRKSEAEMKLEEGHVFYKRSN